MFKFVLIINWNDELKTGGLCVRKTVNMQTELNGQIKDVTPWMEEIV